jgi:archaellum component FlaC
MSNYDELHKEFAELSNEIKEIEKKIGEITNPLGCRIYKIKNYWLVMKPEGNHLVVSRVEEVVTDPEKFYELFTEFQKIKERMRDIVDEFEKLGCSGVGGMKTTLIGLH